MTMRCLLPEQLCASGTNVRYLRMHGGVTVTQQVAVATAGNYTLSVYGYGSMIDLIKSSDGIQKRRLSAA